MSGIFGASILVESYVHIGQCINEGGRGMLAIRLNRTMGTRIFNTYACNNFHSTSAVAPRIMI